MILNKNLLHCNHREVKLQQQLMPTLLRTSYQLRRPRLPTVLLSAVSKLRLLTLLDLNVTWFCFCDLFYSFYAMPSTKVAVVSTFRINLQICTFRGYFIDNKLRV